jgi:hypothetical protein
MTPSERGRLGGLVGGKVTASRHSHEWCVARGKLGGRPTFSETLEKDRLLREQATKRNGRQS